MRTRHDKTIRCLDVLNKRGDYLNAPVKVRLPAGPPRVAGPKAAQPPHGLGETLEIASRKFSRRNGLLMMKSTPGIELRVDCNISA